jgi:hypothetical protein
MAFTGRDVNFLSPAVCKKEAGLSTIYFPRGVSRRGGLFFQGRPAFF